jgi:phosphate-selective porin OprO and OprP
MNIKLSKLISATVLGGSLLAVQPAAFADSTSDLINALIAKGVLTEEEGALLMKGRTGEREAAEAKSKKEIRVVNKDGIKFENEDKSVSVSLGGRIHADYRAFDHDGKDSGTNTANESDTFDMRRARLILNGQLYDHYTFWLSGDFAGGTTGNSATNSSNTANTSSVAILDQAWLNVNYWAPLQFRVGQFKVPMSMERKMSSNSLDFLERSLHDGIGTYEDRGAMIWGVPKDGLTYAFAVVNGEGNKNRNDVDSRVSMPEYQLNGTANFAQLFDIKDSVYHVGVGFSDTDISKNNNNSGATTSNTFWLAGSNSYRTEARGITFLTLPSLISQANTSNAIHRQRYALEGAVAKGPIKFTAEWLRNNFSGDFTPTQSFDADIDAWYVSTLWNITGEKFSDFYKEGIFSGVKPTKNFDWGNGGGAWQIGLRYSHMDARDFNKSVFTTASAFSNGVSAATNTYEAGAWTAGINFVPNPNTRFMVNFIQTNFDTPVLIEGKPTDKERAVTARAQWNF